MHKQFTNTNSLYYEEEETTIAIKVNELTTRMGRTKNNDDIIYRIP